MIDFQDPAMGVFAAGAALSFILIYAAVSTYERRRRSERRREKARPNPKAEFDVLLRKEVRRRVYRLLSKVAAGADMRLDDYRALDELVCATYSPQATASFRDCMIRIRRAVHQSDNDLSPFVGDALIALDRDLRSRANRGRRASRHASPAAHLRSAASQ